jgi:murein DD-endopeptidase MepM/ murein hydrolase activator NlpD
LLHQPKNSGLAAVLSLVLLLAPVAGARASPAGSASSSTPRFDWPVVGRVLRGFEPPPTPFSAGHRGIDIAAPFGTPIHAPAAGVVSFAGWVAGSMFVTIDHSASLKSSFSWLSGIKVKKGETVTRGQVVAFTGHGHPDVATPHLHFSVRVDGNYVDPMAFLGFPDLVSLLRLVPLDGTPWASALAAAVFAPPPRMGAPSDAGCSTCQPLDRRHGGTVPARPP